MKFRPEPALSRLQRAEVRLNHYPQKKGPYPPRLRHLRIPGYEDATVPGENTEAQEDIKG